MGRRQEELREEGIIIKGVEGERGADGCVKRSDFIRWEKEGR